MIIFSKLDLDYSAGVVSSGLFPIVQSSQSMKGRPYGTVSRTFCAC